MRALLYTWSHCSFCARAREILERHGIEYREEVLDGRKAELRRLQRLFGKRTVPLLVLDGERVGGLEELEELEREGELDARDA